jgi:hypothetical protein
MVNETLAVGGVLDLAEDTMATDSVLLCTHSSSRSKQYVRIAMLLTNV